MSVQALNQTPAQSAGSTSTTQGTNAANGPAPLTGASTTNKSVGAPSQQASYRVSISSAARAALAEATETSVQTAKEASGGDQQAQRLLVKEAATKAG